ncbi:MAG: OmpA family protein [Bacteroidetes bacterium]|nr:OmpA family protein [Bacteroidota bacterium]MBU1719248.1 OmpA family protein [Bacteroidota bacterium]
MNKLTRNIAILFLILTSIDGFSQNQDQMFVTEGNLYGLIYLKKGNVVNNSFEVTVTVDWVDKNLVRIEDKTSCIVLEKDCVQVFPLGVAQCLNFAEQGTDYLAFNEELKLKFGVNQDKKPANATIRLPFRYSASQEKAGNATGRSNFFYSHPVKLEVLYDLSTGTSVEEINVAKVTMAYSGLTDPNSNEKMDAGENVTLHYSLKNTGENASGEIVVVISETNHIDGLSLQNTFNIPSLDAGEERKLDIPVKCSKEIQNGEAHFRIVANAGGADNSFVLNQKIPVRAEIKEGKKFELKNVYFEYREATLAGESYNELKNLLQIMQENETLVIEIAGHTDNIGGTEYNQNLSQKRAETVANYLIANKIKKERIVAKGYGETKPIATNDTEDGRARNRRVEFVIIKR